jgi:hypothetical protein
MLESALANALRAFRHHRPRPPMALEEAVHNLSFYCHKSIGCPMEVHAVARFASVFRLQHFPLCLMVAGSKHIDPDQDVGMDRNDPWLRALGLFHGGR